MTLDSISRTIDRALSAAGLDTRQGMPQQVMQTIQQALHPARAAQARPAQPVAPGRFLAHEHAGPRGRRAYKLYLPCQYDGTRALPLVVMLHGCKQDPDDFARGTRMNQLAEEHGFLVAYPGQSAQANGSNCWRWFETPQQSRDGAEPSIIAGIVRDVAAAQRVDAGRVYVAGLSAGAAMALVLADGYPELFAAAAVHSGLPLGAAHDVASAFAAMREGATGRRGAALPTIVFHGEADATVAPANGQAVARQAAAALAARHGPLEPERTELHANGRRCTRTRLHTRDGLCVAEHWAVQGGGHAWFGGSEAGSFTSAAGPDASLEMLRFFAQHARHPAAPGAG